MYHKKFISLLFMGCTSFYIIGCGEKSHSSVKDGYYHNGIYFGKNFPGTYKRGIRDGCTTAKGTYKKSHKLFNNDQHYNDGWFLGRNRCRHLLVIENDEIKSG